MNRTLRTWLLLLLPGVLIAGATWYAARVTPAQMEECPWRLSYNIRHPITKNLEVLGELNEHAMKDSGSVGWDASKTNVETELPRLYRQVREAGITFSAADDFTFGMQEGSSNTLALLARTSVNHHQKLYRLLLWPIDSTGGMPSGGVYVISEGPWREIEFAPKWLRGIILRETIYWNLSRSQLRPTRRVELDYSALTKTADYKNYVARDWLEINSRRLRCKIPLWGFVFLLSILPTPFFYLLRQPLMRLLPARLRPEPTR